MRFLTMQSKEGDLTVEKKGKKNIFSGRILEIDLTEMETDLTVEQSIRTF